MPIRSGTTAGNHCCYRRGNHCTDSECGGTVDKVTPQDWTTYLQHTMEDVLPAVYCCKGTFPNCGSYQQKRPIDDGSKSPPPPPVPGKHVSRNIHINVCPICMMTQNINIHNDLYVCACMSTSMINIIMYIIAHSMTVQSCCVQLYIHIIIILY